MFELVFHDVGAAFLLLMFLVVHLLRPIRVKGKVLDSGGLSVAFTIILILYVVIRVYA